MKKLTKLLAFLIVLPFLSYAQSESIGVLPLQDNSSFAGAAEESRLILSSNYSYDYPAYLSESSHYDVYASYDKFIRAISSGIGFSVYHYDQKTSFQRGNGGFYNNKFSMFNGIIAPKFSINNKITISPSFNFLFRNVKTEASGAPEFNYDGNIWGGSIGLSINNSNTYFAFSTNLFQSEYPLYTDVSFLVFQAGHSFYFSGNKKYSLTPHFSLSVIGKNELDLNTIDLANYLLSLKLDTFTFGLYNLPYKDLFPRGVQVGLQKNGFKFLLGSSFYKIYTAQLTVRYLFHQDDHFNTAIY